MIRLRLGLGFDFNGSPPLPILDTLSAAAAYSLRLLRTAYAGFCIRVRRSSDNTELNIGFVGGVIDTVALLAFVGAGDGFVVTWYDQSVNARDATQASAGSQPRIVTAGVLETQNGKPSLITYGIASIRASSWGLVPQPFTRNYVIADGGVANGGHVVNSFNGSPNTADYKNGASTIAMFEGNVDPSTSLPTTPTVFVSTFSGASSSLSKDGVVGTGNSGTQGCEGVGLFSSNTGGVAPWTGKCSEFTLFASTLSTADRQLLEANQKAYYGTP